MNRPLTSDELRASFEAADIAAGLAAIRPATDDDHALETSAGLRFCEHPECNRVGPRALMVEAADAYFCPKHGALVTVVTFSDYRNQREHRIAVPDYVQLTGDVLRGGPDGDEIASYDRRDAAWHIVAGGPGDPGIAWSDVTMGPATPPTRRIEITLPDIARVSVRLRGDGSVMVTASPDDDDAPMLDVDDVTVEPYVAPEARHAS